MSDKPSSQGRIDLQEYVGILLRRRWIVLLCFVSVLSSTLVGSVLMTPIYEATTTLQVEEKELKIGSDLLRAMETFRATASLIDSEVEILKSRTVAEEVVRKLNLDKEVRKISKGVSFSMSAIGTDGSAKPGDYTIVLENAQGRYGLFNDAQERIGTGESGGAFQAGGLSFTISEVKAKPGDKIGLTIYDFQAAVQRLRSNLAVDPVRNTNIIKVMMTSPDPHMAASAANAIAEAYASQNLKRRTGQAFSAREFLDKQLHAVQAELRTSERALGDYKAKVGVITLDDETKASVGKLTQIELERAKVEAERTEAQSLLGLLKDPERASGKGLLISTSGVRNPLIVDLSKKLTDLEIQRSSMEEGFTPRHPAVLAVRGQIEEVRRRLIGEVEGALSALRERERALAGIIKGYEKDLRNLPAAELNLVALLRTSKVNEGVYTFLLQKHEEARIAEASDIGNVRLVDPAIPPKLPTKPKTKLNMILGAIVGLLMGVGMAFFLERLDNSIKGADDLEKGIGLPVFGLIPEIRQPRRTRGRIGTSVNVQEGGTTLITRLQPRSVVTEAYRHLRANIQYADPDRSAKAVLLTSAGPGEGKTTTAANLAIALAHMGRQVLLVDADLRRPALHLLFGCPREPGLTDILVGNVPWRGAIQPSGVQGLGLIASGAAAPNPVELLGSKSMVALLDDIRSAFDVILFDSPPSIALADACVVGSKLDGAFLIVEAGRTTSQMVARAKAILENVNVRVAGAILNKVKVDGLGYGYHRYSKYYDDEVGSRKNSDASGLKTFIQRFLLRRPQRRDG